MRSQTGRLTALALLIALTVVLTRWGSIRLTFLGLETLRIGIGALPVILTGVLYGPVAGFLVGAVGDVLGWAISPMGPYMPWFTITTGLCGAIPALVIWALGGRERPLLWHLFVGIAIGQLIAAVVLVPLGLLWLFKVPLAATLWPRLVVQAVLLPIHALLVRAVLLRLQPFWRLRAVPVPASVGKSGS